MATSAAFELVAMDSSTSEKSQTRPNTPLSDLNDHRSQLSSVPRIDAIGSPRTRITTRRNTVQSVVGARPDLLQVDQGLREANSISRDFEHAIIDDERSVNGDNVIERRPSFTPAVGRRGTGRRGQLQHDKPSRSRDSSVSSRSISPPNSVDAFAEPRRRERKNTIGSKAPSELDLPLSRTVSASTHHRWTAFSNGSIHRGEGQNSDDYRDPAAQDDISFHELEETSKSFRIDFEELEEFVAQCSRGRAPAAYRCRQRLSFSSKGNPPKVFDDLRNMARHDIPHIINQSPSPIPSPINVDSDCALDDAKSLTDEKGVNMLGAKVPLERRPSLVEFHRYSFFSSELEQTIHAPELGDLTMPGETFRDLFSLPPEGGAWWLDVVNPTSDEIHAFERAFGLHRLTQEDIIDQEAREKVELFKQYYFVCFRSFFQMDETSEDYMEPVNIYMVVFRQGILTFSYSPSPHAANVRKRIGELRDYMALTSDWICYSMINNIVDTFGPVITSIEHETDQIEDQVFVARTDDYTPLLRQIGECRKKVMSLMRLLGGKADVIKGFAKRCNEQYTVTPRGEIGLYLGDIQDHVVTMMSNLGHFEKMLSRSHSNYLAQLSVDNMAQGNRANRVLGKITMIATILVPLNMISGLFGMNVNVPGKDAGGLGWFFGIIGVIATIVVVSLGTLRRYRYI